MRDAETESTDVSDGCALSWREKVDIALAAARPAFRTTAWVLFLSLLGLALTMTPSASAYLYEWDHDYNDVFGFPPDLIWYGCSTDIYGYYSNPSSQYYYSTSHGAGAASQMPGVTLADNAIEFYSDMYDNWYYSSQWNANFFRGPRQPGFEGAGSYDVAHFWVFGFYTALTVESTIMRIPS